MFNCILSAALILASDVGTHADQAAATHEHQEVALEAALRRFRIETYNAYSTNLAELRRRRSAWEQVQARWRDAGGRREDHAALIAWLDRATRETTRRGPLPPAPNFGAPPTERNLQSDRASGTDSRTSATSADVGEAPLWSPPSPVSADSDVAAPDSPDFKTSTGIAELSNPSGVPGTDAAKTVPSPRAAATASVTNRFQTTPNAPRTWVKRPPSSPRAAPRPSQLDALSAAARALGSDDLNLNELFSRAAGYEVGLRSVESTLLDPSELDAQQLAALLAELETLVGQRRDLLLYQGLLPPDAQARLSGSLGFPQATVAELGTRIAVAREQLTANPRLDEKQFNAQLQSLEQLSKRLSRLTEK
jgi:hypothetical protein